MTGTHSTQAIFATTHWSIVLSARDQELPEASAALEKLCGAYWYPLYAFIRRSGYTREDAEDLVQAFFARLLEKNFLEAVEPCRGRFRSFLLMALKRFLANEWDRTRAQKRGGGVQPIPLDIALAERKFEAELATGDLSPEGMYERRWALTLLEQTMARLRAEFEVAGKVEEFERLKPYLTPDREALENQKSDGATRVAAHRLRKRYRELIRQEIARTLAEGDDIAGELRHLLAVLSK